MDSLPCPDSPSPLFKGEGTPRQRTQNRLFDPPQLMYGGIQMAKKGMARPEWTHTQPRNEVPPVPMIQGKAKHGKERANPILEGTSGPEQKVYHDGPAGR